MDTSVEYSVLLVEDSQDDARFVCAALRDFQKVQFTPQHVPDLGSALRALAGIQFDVVLLDLGLPDATGIEAVRRICQSNPDLPVVVLTGNTSDRIAVEAIENGAQDFLAKQLPFPNSERLARTLRYAIARRYALPRIRKESASPAREKRNPDEGNVEAALDEIKGRLQLLTMQSGGSLSDKQERELITVELRDFVDTLALHFNGEESACLSRKENLPSVLVEHVTRLLEEHASLHQKFYTILKRADAVPLPQLKREVLAALCCFIEHEISESTLLELVNKN